MLEKTITELLEKAGIKWTVTIKDKTYQIQPNEEDVLIMLESMAEQLEKPGESVTIGGLRLEKHAKGHDVYCYLGDYL